MNKFKKVSATLLSLGTIFAMVACGSTEYSGEDFISIEEVVAKKLAAMDLTASIMCMEQKMPMLVFELDEEHSIVNTVHGNFSGTRVTV